MEYKKYSIFYKTSFKMQQSLKTKKIVTKMLEDYKPLKDLIMRD